MTPPLPEPGSPPEPGPHEFERRVDPDASVGAGPGAGVARHRLEPDPADHDAWDTERMRAAVPRELRREPSAGRHATDAQQRT